MIRLKLYCFGVFMAVLDGSEIRFRSDKARALLAYLLLSGQQAVPRTVLQALFWEGYESKSARGNLRVTLSHLAKVLKPLKVLHITRKSVQLDLSAQALWCDVWAFEALAQQKSLNREQLQEAKTLYPTGRLRAVGDVLAGLRLEECPAFEQWRREQAKRYREQLIGLFGHNLPRQGTTFIGRQEEIDAIMKKVLNPDYPLITLMGTGGVGKSRLALSVGEKARGHFSDGVWWVPLAGLEMTDMTDSQRLPEELAQGIGQALNVTFKPNEQTCPDGGRITPQLFKHLRDFDGLLLLDNLEHLLPATLDEESTTVNFILELLRQTERLTILVTSRQRLNVPQEFVFYIQGLPLPEEMTLDQVANKPSNPALKLFAERANRPWPRFELNESNFPFVKRICQDVAGLPLGIELAAGLLASQTVTKIALSMIKAQNRLALSATWRSLPPRQRSLEALFEHSWDLLTPSQQETFAQLAVFRSGFTAQAASQVINVTQVELSALLAKSLLQQDASGRYQMHQLLHDFAAQKLAFMGGIDARERHASYYLDFLAQQEKKIEEASNREPLNETQRELNNIRAAWQWAVKQSHVVLLMDSASAFRLLAERLGLIKEGIEAMQHAIKQLRGLRESQGVKETLAVLLLQQTILLDKTTQFDFALRCIQEIVHLATTPQMLGWATYYWGTICDYQANYSDAQEKYLQARTFFRQAGEQEGQKKVFHGLAALAYSLEEYSNAQQYFEELYNLTPYEKNSQFKGAITLNLGTIHRMQGHYNEALLYQQKALTLFRQIGEPFWQGLAMTNHALLALHLGNYEQASSYFAQADKLW